VAKNQISNKTMTETVAILTRRREKYFIRINHLLEYLLIVSGYGFSYQWGKHGKP
jgi:hypothetical protein